MDTDIGTSWAEVEDPLSAHSPIEKSHQHFPCLLQRLLQRPFPWTSHNCGTECDKYWGPEGVGFEREKVHHKTLSDSVFSYFAKSSDFWKVTVIVSYV